LPGRAAWSGTGCGQHRKVARGRERRRNARRHYQRVTHGDQCGRPQARMARLYRKPGKQDWGTAESQDTAARQVRAGQYGRSWLQGERGGAMGGDLAVAKGAAGSRRGPDPIRALIVDDHALFRRGLEMVLAAEDDIELVGEASDGAEAVEKAAESLPDVVLMDIRMPKSSGIEACRAMKEAAPSSKIVILTISDEEEDLFEAIRAGASGYLLKDIPLDEVAEVVRAVYGGQSLINPSMAGKLLTEFATLAKRDDEERAQRVPAPKLTDREMQVLKLVARGMNNRDIAKELFISENTVKNHVRNILEKLQIHSRMEAVMIAVREKLIEFS